MAMGEVALVTTVPTDCAGIVFSDVRAARCSPDVRPTFSAGGLFEIGRTRPRTRCVSLVLGCRFGPDSVDFPELTDSGEAMTHRLPNGDVVGVATAVVPAVGRPELTELCAAMQSIQSTPTMSAGGSSVSVGLVNCRMASSCLGGLPPRMWMRRPRQSGGSENSCAKRSA